jgi:hypothetical protein
MKILSYAQYLHCWKEDFGQTGCPPCYHEYLQREVYKRDFFDLFRKEKNITFKRTKINGRFYIPITSCPILLKLEIPVNELFTIKNSDEISYLIVDYDFQWKEDLNESPSIKFIKIGEAAPQPNPKTVGYGGDDKNNSFYYNILHIKNTGYFTEPLKAFGIDVRIKTSIDKKEALKSLAENSSILFDIFPFAINYDPIRNNLNKKGITAKYFNELMNSLKELLMDEKYNFDENVKGVFLAPPKISHFLAIKINETNLEIPVSFEKMENTFHFPHCIKTKNNFFFDKISVSNKIYIRDNSIELPPNAKKKEFAIRTPTYACCAYSGAMTAPHYLFIKKGLGLI